MNLNKKISLITAFLIVCFLLLPMQYLRADDGDGNMDGGGGGMGTGSSSSFWTPGKDGVRVTIVTLDGQRASASIDYSNSNYGSNVWHFQKKCKTDYRENTYLTPQNGGYTYRSAPGMPTIISTNANSNIIAVKKYFCKENTLRDIAATAGIDFDTMVNGNYKILIEPIAYFTFRGEQIAATATECALYDQIMCGDLAYDMGSLTHQNLPLAIFLERPDLGFPSNTVYTGTQTRANIISKLGIGTVSFDGSDGFTPIAEDNGPQISPAHYNYHTNIDVYTAAAIVNNTGIDVTDGTATITITGDNGFNEVIEIPVKNPRGRDGYIWWQWHTPAAPQNITMTVSLTDGLEVKTNPITATVSSFGVTEPPDPKGTDRNDAFVYLPYSSGENNTITEWGQWLYDYGLVSDGGQMEVFHYNENASYAWGAWGAEKKYVPGDDDPTIPTETVRRRISRTVVKEAWTETLGYAEYPSYVSTYPPSNILPTDKLEIEETPAIYGWSSWKTQSWTKASPVSSSSKEIRNVQARYVYGFVEFHYEYRNYIVTTPAQIIFKVYNAITKFHPASTTYYIQIRNKVWTGSGTWVSSLEQYDPLMSAVPLWTWYEYAATLSATATTVPSESCPTTTSSNGKIYIKSGYGVKTTLAYTLNGGDVYTTPVQNTYSLFPEFNYSTYGRWHEATTNSNTKEYLRNRYSRFSERVHFTPIWYPDNQEYVVVTYADDAWTPGGKLVSWTTSSLWIDGNVYDDWHIRPTL